MTKKYGQLKVKVVMTCTICGGTAEGSIPAGWGAKPGDVIYQDHLSHEVCKMFTETMAKRLSLEEEDDA